MICEETRGERLYRRWQGGESSCKFGQGRSWVSRYQGNVLGTKSGKSRSVNADEIVKVKKTAVGRGVFACQDHAAESVIGEIEGEVMGLDHESNYCMDLEGKALLEPAAPFRFLNHSCEPNCQLLLWKYQNVGGRRLRRIWVSTLRDVRAGEELTIDYAWPMDAAVPCLCGAATCRGWVVDKNELRRPRRMCRTNKGPLAASG